MILKGQVHPSLRRLREMWGRTNFDDPTKEEKMFLKKVDGPRAVTLPDGTVMTRADLPPKTTRRWVASRKAAVVRGVLYGLIPQSEALRRYSLSEEEFRSWVSAVADFGEDALKATRLKDYRKS
ncbi:hypothetical protein PhaeoP75_02009 [Phaeobacter gallaeciensis]|uniref:DUF1153 domain-containing protein n=2 Tax=Phaeobacter TaxID=302485 RepID=A0AAC9ZAT0_9RHOB|nr:hypothetical protein Gal_01968 [Phaeobacter gallaeciensis DSM 26640]ATE92984.1 hypothetical protein PhaeoP11_01959 [Phaeobacter gallaeciensis]ATE97194.1 hypothetical protein PhaeoP73_01887 [Phaeobacter gallaeciensis]ATF01649.1 hypothetical protein PhaeoP75_02009 [Phaeobacter gallaeciensis]ATF06029.1 hypothetical protein PhaeoP63_01957 [Phaeobacter gallaeciensis]